MQKVTIIPTIREAFSCVFRHPQVIVPFFVFSLIVSLLYAYLFNKITSLFDIFSVSEEMPFEAMGAFFSFFSLIILVVVVYFFGFPFFEGWTFAALGSAFKKEPVRLMEAARRGLSKYFGVLAITILVAVVTSLVSGFLSTILLFPLLPFMNSEMYTRDFFSNYPQSFWFPPGLAVFYGVLILIVIAVTVFFVYLKPAYILGEKPFAESLNDGFNTARKNFMPSFVYYLVFTVLQIVVFAIVFGAFMVSSIPLLEDLILTEDISVMTTFFERLIPLGVVAVILNFLVYVFMYAAVTYAYMYSHEMAE